jgi:hypothetical protein
MLFESNPYGSQQNLGITHIGIRNDIVSIGFGSIIHIVSIGFGSIILLCLGNLHASTCLRSLDCIYSYCNTLILPMQHMICIAYFFV